MTASGPAATVRCTPIGGMFKCEKMCILESMKLVIKVYACYFKKMGLILSKLFKSYCRALPHSTNEKVHGEF
jgi:hypothetical protein